MDNDGTDIISVRFTREMMERFLETFNALEVLTPDGARITLTAVVNEDECTAYWVETMTMPKEVADARAETSTV